MSMSNLLSWASHPRTHPSFLTSFHPTACIPSQIANPQSSCFIYSTVQFIYHHTNHYTALHCAVLPPVTTTSTPLSLSLSLPRKISKHPVRSIPRRLTNLEGKRSCINYITLQYATLRYQRITTISH